MRPSYDKETARAVSGRLSLRKPAPRRAGFAIAAVTSPHEVALLAARELSAEVGPEVRRLLCRGYPSSQGTPPELRKQQSNHAASPAQSACTGIKPGGGCSAQI